MSRAWRSRRPPSRRPCTRRGRATSGERMMETRDWKLVAPWYRWDRQLAEQKLRPRQTRPVFQKFDQSDFVKGFARDPQHSLKFDDRVDTVFSVKETDVPALTSGPNKGKFSRFFIDKAKSVAKDLTLTPTGIRKLYLDTHKRYYLVVCELHCDAPGFPTTTPDQVCEAGFAVRRRSYNFPNGARKEAVKLLQNVVAIQSDIAYYEQTSPARGLKAKHRALIVEKLKKGNGLEAKISGLKSELDAARQEIVKWKDLNGVVQIHEGWVRGEFENIGSWQYVEETPAKTAEATYPLYQLFADPNDPAHSAKGRNIYFGVVPTSSLDTDERGGARFDSETLYEIRCYVRRHKPDCPRRDQKPDCPGPLVWSEPTESYRLAAASDLIGTSQHPVTIHMPDLKELAAQAASLPLNKFSPMKVVKPQSMNFSVNDGKATGGSVGLPQICFISIPLITIVAMFVFSLFLPIVVFLFGLFFLLALKFCIPPSIQIDAGLSAQLDVVAPKIELDASFDVDVFASLDAGGGFGTFGAADLNAKLQGGITASAGFDKNAPELSGADLSKLSNAALVNTGLSVREADKTAKAVGSDLSAAAGVELTASLQWEERVEVRAS